MPITAEEVVKLFEEDARARRRLAELLVSEPNVRLALANAILREVATKEDLRQLREELRAEMRDLREELKAEMQKLREELKDYVDARVNGLERRISDLAAFVRASLVAIVVTLASTILTPLILKLLGLL